MAVDRSSGAIIIDCLFVHLYLVLTLLKSHHLILFNGAYDLHTINRTTDYPWFPKKIDDVVYLSRLKYYTKGKFDFYACLEHANLNDELIDSIDKKKAQKSDWSGPLTQQQKTYSACDVTYLARLYEDVKDFRDSTVYQLDVSSLKHAITYTRNGMPIDQKVVRKHIESYLVKLENTLEKLPVNPRSFVQVRKYLNSSASDESALTKMSQAGDERAQWVLDARHYYKSLEYLHSYNVPILRGFFQPCAALSGRFSCTGGDVYGYANLQQIPGKLHDVVVAEDGWVLVYKDYSGLELRMAVSFTGEPVMAAMMKAGMDMHAETAKYIFGKEEITELERTIAKTFNFALIYGAGVFTIQDKLKVFANIDMSHDQVRTLIKMWFDMYEYFTEWHNIHKNQLDVYGYVNIETALGRKVRTYKLTDSLNIPIQGSSVEVQKVAVCMLHERYPNVTLIDTIHDSNLLLSPENEVGAWGEALDECMIDAWNYVIEDLADPDIPMPKGYEYGPVWTWH